MFGLCGPTINLMRIRNAVSTTRNINIHLSCHGELFFGKMCKLSMLRNEQNETKLKKKIFKKIDRQNCGLRPSFPPSGDRKKIILHLPCLHWKTIKLILFVSCC